MLFMNRFQYSTLRVLYIHHILELVVETVRAQKLLGYSFDESKVVRKFLIGSRLPEIRWTHRTYPANLENVWRRASRSPDKKVQQGKNVRQRNLCLPVILSLKMSDESLKAETSGEEPQVCQTFCPVSPKKFSRSLWERGSWGPNFETWGTWVMGREI